MISANQLSFYGAVADLCNEVPKDLRAPGKLAAPNHLAKMEIPTDLSTGCAASIGAPKFRTLFSLCFRHTDSIFP